MNPDEPLVLCGDPLFRLVGDEVFILAAQGRVHWLKNPTARFIWDAYAARPAGGLSVRTLAARIVAEFDVEPPEALADASDFVGALVANGLLAPGRIDSDPGQT